MANDHDTKIEIEYELGKLGRNSLTSTSHIRFST